MDDIGEWIMSYHKIPIAEYEKLAIASTRRSSTPTRSSDAQRNAPSYSKHHEVHFNDADPHIGCDVRATLSPSLAPARHGMNRRDYSQALDWHERNAGGWDDPAYLPARRPGPTYGLPTTRYISRIFLAQGAAPGHGATDALRRHIPHMVRHAPDDIRRAVGAPVPAFVPSARCLTRIGNGTSDYWSPRQPARHAAHVSHRVARHANDTWAKYYDHNWKDSGTSSTFIRPAARTNFLLNIGPRGDGSTGGNQAMSAGRRGRPGQRSA